MSLCSRFTQQSKTVFAWGKFDAQLVSLVWCVEVEARSPIVTHICWRLIGVMGRLCQHSHGPISTATHDIMLQMHRVMDWQISAEAKFETQLVSLVWCVETEARPPIVTHSCWWLNEVMGKLWQHSHAHGTFSAETLMSLRPIEAPSNNNNNQRQFWIKLNLKDYCHYLMIAKHSSNLLVNTHLLHAILLLQF